MTIAELAELFEAARLHEKAIGDLWTILTRMRRQALRDYLDCRGRGDGRDHVCHDLIRALRCFELLPEYAEAAEEVLEEYREVQERAEAEL